MNLFVTGANGYVGSSYINYFKDKYIFKKFSLLNQKLEDINFNKIEVVLHCAALVHQKAELSYKKYYKINVDYPVELATLAKQSGVKQFVFMSTVAVYGEDKELIDEHTICNPATHYGKSKLQAEKKLLELNDDTFSVSIIRAPMIYGKKAPGNIDSLIKFIKKSSIIPLGCIENKRSFISIQNLCHIIDEVIVQQKSGIFLATDDTPLSTTKLIELIAKNLDKKVYLIKLPFFESLLKLLKPSFHKRLYGSLEVDNSLTNQTLFGATDSALSFSVEDGIRLMLNGDKS